jgi:ankyrin repeat protein
MSSPTGSALTEAFAAVEEGNLTRLRELVHLNPVFASVHDDEGVSLIMRALYRRRTEMVELLLSADPELDLFTASALGRTTIVARLLDDDPQAVDSSAGDGFTPLHLAAFFARPETARLLLDRGAGLETISRNEMAVRPLHAAVAGRSLEITALLVTRGAEPGSRQRGGWTPLHGAAEQGNLEMVRALLAHGARIDLASDDGRTALQLAEANGHQDLVRLLGGHSG